MVRYATCRATFARVVDPIGAFKESLEFDIGAIGHRIHTRPLTRYAGAADIQCAARAKPPPCRKLDSRFAFNLKFKSMKMLRKCLKKCQKIDENGGLWRSGRLHLAPGGHLGAKMAPKIAKRSPKRRQDSQHGAKMGQHGSKMGSQICSKIMKNRLNICFLIAFWIEFWRDLGAKNRRKHD